MMKWISSDDQLPEERKYVLGIHNKGTWNDSNDQQHVNMVIVSLRKGISADNREKMKRGDMEDPSDSSWMGFGGPMTLKRSSVIEACDEGGNNKRPYNWETFGPSSFFGQSITHWCQLPDPPVEYITGKSKHIPLMEKIQAQIDTIPNHVLEWLKPSNK